MEDDSGLKTSRRVPQAVALGWHHLVFLEHSSCLLKSTLIAETLEDSEIHKGEHKSLLQPQRLRRRSLLQPGLPVSFLLQSRWLNDKGWVWF